MQETPVSSLGWEDLLEKGMAILLSLKTLINFKYFSVSGPSFFLIGSTDHTLEKFTYFFSLLINKCSYSLLCFSS